MADNDLAFGRIVETISHSKVWKESAIFGVEDDTQNGVDHVDGHRGPAFVISPYSKGGVEDEYGTQLNMVRTVEQILGIQPMNQEDYAAEPMYGAFTEKPNFEPYTALPNQIPLTLGVAGFPSTATTTHATAPKTADRACRGRGAGLDAECLQGLDELEAASSASSGMDGMPDSAKPELLNRFDWYSAHDWKRGVPGRPEDLPAGRSARQRTARRLPRRLRLQVIRVINLRPAAPKVARPG